MANSCFHTSVEVKTHLDKMRVSYLASKVSDKKKHSLTYFMIFLIAFPRVLDLSSDLGYIFFWLFF